MKHAVVSSPGEGSGPVVQALRDTEARYKAALHAGGLGSWETDFRAGCRRWTDEGLALFGLTLPGNVGQVGVDADEWLAAIHPDDRAAALRLRRQAETLDSFAAEYRIVRPDGQIVWLSGRGQVAERDGKGRPLRLVSIMADISEQRRAEAAMRDSEARFRSIFENVAVGMAYTDTAGHWIEVNKRLCSILGYSFGHWSERRPGSSRAACLRGHAKALRARIALACSLDDGRFASRDGHRSSASGPHAFHALHPGAEAGRRPRRVAQILREVAPGNTGAGRRGANRAASRAVCVGPSSPGAGQARLFALGRRGHGPAPRRYWNRYAGHHRRRDRCLRAATVLGGIDRGYRGIVVSDALCSSADKQHDALLAPYRERFSKHVEVTTAGEVIERLRP